MSGYEACPICGNYHNGSACPKQALTDGEKIASDAMKKVSDGAIREVILRVRTHEPSGTNSAENLARLAEAELAMLENIACGRKLEMPGDKYELSNEELEIFSTNTNHPVSDLATELLAARQELARLKEAVRFIPVSERLPNEERNYEIGRKGVFLGTGYWDIDKKRFEMRTNSGYAEVAVDCWRELPVPPAPVEEGK